MHENTRAAAANERTNEREGKAKGRREHAASEEHIGQETPGQGPLVTHCCFMRLLRAWSRTADDDHRDGLRNERNYCCLKNELNPLLYQDKSIQTCPEM